MLPLFKLNTNESTEELISTEGFEGPIIEALAKFMNFRVQVVDCYYQWGKKGEDGSWGGIIESLIDGVNFQKMNKLNIKYIALIDQDAKIGFGAITVNSDRNEEIRFAYPYIIDSATFTTAHPPKLGYSSTLLAPFESHIWMCLMALVFLVFFLSYCLSDYMPNGSQIRWDISAIILSQPISSFKADIPSVNILMLFWLFAALVLRNYYCGEMFGLMAVASETDKIETIDALADELRGGRVKVIGMFTGLYATKIRATQVLLNKLG